jgi:hypothetical protein
LRNLLLVHNSANDELFGGALLEELINQYRDNMQNLYAKVGKLGRAQFLKPAHVLSNRDTPMHYQSPFTKHPVTERTFTIVSSGNSTPYLGIQNDDGLCGVVYVEDTHFMQCSAVRTGDSRMCEIHLDNHNLDPTGFSAQEKRIYTDFMAKQMSTLDNYNATVGNHSSGFWQDRHTSRVNIQQRGSSSSHTVIKRTVTAPNRTKEPSFVDILGDVGTIKILKDVISLLIQCSKSVPTALVTKTQYHNVLKCKFYSDQVTWKGEADPVEASTADPDSARPRRKGKNVNYAPDKIEDDDLGSEITDWRWTKATANRTKKLWGSYGTRSTDCVYH